MNIYQLCLSFGLVTGFSLGIFLMMAIDLLKYGKFMKFLGDNKLLNKYYDYKKYNR